MIDPLVLLDEEQVDEAPKAKVMSSFEACLTSQRSKHLDVEYRPEDDNAKIVEETIQTTSVHTTRASQSCIARESHLHLLLQEDTFA